MSDPHAGAGVAAMDRNLAWPRRWSPSRAIGRRQVPEVGHYVI
jgi:hypothetical protein